MSIFRGTHVRDAADADRRAAEPHSAIRNPRFPISPIPSSTRTIRDGDAALSEKPESRDLH
jgi:hypothetical protein